jgi:hypothetical protein
MPGHEKNDDAAALLHILIKAQLLQPVQETMGLMELLGLK